MKPCLQQIIRRSQAGERKDFAAKLEEGAFLGSLARLGGVGDEDLRLGQGLTIQLSIGIEGPFLNEGESCRNHVVGQPFGNKFAQDLRSWRQCARRYEICPESRLLHGIKIRNDNARSDSRMLAQDEFDLA